MDERRSFLVDSHTKRLNVELKKDSRGAVLMVQNPLVVGHTILVSVQWLCARSDVCRRYDIEIILVGNESCNGIYVQLGKCGPIRHSRAWASSYAP